MIVSTVALEFAAHGYEGASLSRIVREAGTSKGGLYYWFEDKQDLFVHTAGTVLSPLGIAVGKPGPVGSVEGFWSAVLGMFERGWAFLRADQTALSMLRVAVRGRAAGDLNRGWKELTADSMGAATEIVLLGRTVGAVRDDLPSDLLIAMVIGIAEAADLWFEDQIDEMDEEEVQGAIEALQDVLKRVASPG